MDPNSIPADWYLNPAVWSYGFATLGFAAFAVQLSVGWKGGGRALLLLASVTLSVFWAVATLAFALDPGWPLWRLAHGFDALRLACAVSFLAVVLLYSGRAGGARGGLLIFALILAPTSLVLLTGMPPPGALIEGNAPTLIFGSHLAVALLGVVLAEQVYRHSPSTLRWNLRPLCIGLAGPFVLDVVIYSDALLFRGLDPHFWAARGFAYALAIPLLGMAAQRNRDWTFDIALSRGVIAGSTAVLAAGVYLLAVAGSGYYVRYFGGSWGKTLQTVILFGAFLLLAFVTVSATFRAKLRVLVAKNFFTYRYDYREEWLKFTRTLTAAGDSQPIEEVCVRALADLVESTGGGLWLRREHGYAQVARINHPQVDAVESFDAALPSFLKRTGWVIEVPMARLDPSSQGGFGLPAWLDALGNAWLAVPLLVGEELNGFVVLDAPRVKMEINWEVRDLLKTAGRQAASYLAMQRATEALLESRKFDAFNRMSAFVVHDLKNLVAQMQLMLRNAQKHAANPEFQRDMLATVEHVVGRMNQLMQQLRSGETPVENPRPRRRPRGPEDRGGARRAGQRARGPAGARDRPPGAERLRRRRRHGAGHRAGVPRRRPRGGGSGGQRRRHDARVHPRPPVQAVPVEQGERHGHRRLREPAVRSGMGIGAYESQQYVASLGGRMEVASAPGAGTRVRVLLPALRPAGASAAQELPA